MRVTPNCDSISSVVVSNATGIQWAPDIVYGGGNYFVVWSDYRNATNYATYGARVSSAGAVLDPGGIQLGSAAGNQYCPSVACNGTRYFAVWGYYSSPGGVTGRFINANGTLYGDTIRLANTNNYVYYTRIAFNGTNYMVIWTEYNTVSGYYDLCGQMVAASGSPSGASFVIATNVYYIGSSSVRWAGNYYLVTYATPSPTYYGMAGRFYYASGAPSGSPFNISNAAGVDCIEGDFVPGANNRYLNVWAQYSSGYDIYGNLDILVGAEEKKYIRASGTRLKSSVVRDQIELVGPGASEFRVFDAAGRSIGTSRDRRFDARAMETGVYFIKTAAGETFKALKVK